MILPYLTTQWPEPWQYEYQERAGIKEFEGRMSRQQAEREAEREMRGLAAREGPNW